MIVLRELAPAKVNLYLHVTGKRADGYHLLDSLTAFADVADKLEYTPSGALTLTCVGPFAAEAPARDNTVLGAAEALRRQFKVTAGANLTLHKNIPIGAGLGGGSADAGAAFRLLSRVWKINPSPKELHALALSIGADVPACLRASSLYMSGIGEAIEAGPPLTGLFAVLVWPGESLLTKDVFAQMKKPGSSAPRHPHMFENPAACVDFLLKNRNDLQACASKLRPKINAVIEALEKQKECLLARMSGSGSACFGLFASFEAAQVAQTAIQSLHPNWWVKAASLR